MSNRLARETSPYLKQHQHNPVDWYPWGPEALGRAKAEDKPILLSIGYSACHWCHVMEAESFENPEIARLMNGNYVCIKVDREERPDLDRIYQTVAQAITHSGGWPLTVFLTPDLKPFFGGTYYPPEDRWGRPGFPRVLTALANAYRQDQASVTENAEKLTQVIARQADSTSIERDTKLLPDRAGLQKIRESMVSEIDWEHGGFGGAPKFPNSMALDFLFRYGASDAAVTSLVAMASGGIYDQLGGGFHRYSVDATWSVPHFEKMLYDNGLLLRSYARVLLADPSTDILTAENRALFLRVLEQTVDYLLREMVSPEGGFYAAQDADSEGEEGKYFVWDPAELSRHLSAEELAAFSKRYGVTENGNFEHGKTVLYLADPSVKADPSGEARLLKLRSTRIPPATDDKILASWNGLAISGLAWTAQALEKAGRVDHANHARIAAVRAFDFLVKRLSRPEDRLFSTVQQNQPKLNAYLDDYAFLAMAAIDLGRFEKNPERRKTYFSQAIQWVDVILAYFKDKDGAGYFFTSRDHETLIHRPKTTYDQAIPSGTGVTIQCLLALAEIRPEEKGREYTAEAEAQLGALYGALAKNPHGYFTHSGELLNAALLWLIGPLVVSGPDPATLITSPEVFPGAQTDQWMICHRQVCGISQPSLDEARAEISGKLKPG